MIFTAKAFKFVVYLYMMLDQECINILIREKNSKIKQKSEKKTYISKTIFLNGVIIQEKL